MSEQICSDAAQSKLSTHPVITGRPLRTALYCRVSTRDKGQETANQLVQLRDFAAAQGWVIVHEYEDHDFSAKPDRTWFQALMRDAMQRKFDVVLFWALDRFTRDGALQTLQYLNTLSSYGVGFRSFTEAYLDSCGIFKDAVISILGTIAKQERLRISEPVKVGLNRAKANGTRSGRPIGRPRVVFSRDEAVQLRARGMSWKQIASRMGVSVGSVRRAVRNAS